MVHLRIFDVEYSENLRAHCKAAVHDVESLRLARTKQKGAHTFRRCMQIKRGVMQETAEERYAILGAFLLGVVVLFKSIRAFVDLGFDFFASNSLVDDLAEQIRHGEFIVLGECIFECASADLEFDACFDFDVHRTFVPSFRSFYRSRRILAATKSLRLSQNIFKAFSKFAKPFSHVFGAEGLAS